MHLVLHNFVVTYILIYAALIKIDKKVHKSGIYVPEYSKQRWNFINIRISDCYSDRLISKSLLSVKM